MDSPTLEESSAVASPAPEPDTPAPSPVVPSAAFLDKCFIPYSADPPTLHGIPIVLGVSTGDHGDNCVVLSRSMVEHGSAQLEKAFTSHTSTTSLIDAHPNSTEVPVTALCSPHLDCLEVVDAAVRYLAHTLTADIIVIDPADLARGRHGVLGPEISDIFWSVYGRLYAKDDLEDSIDASSVDADEKLPPEGSPFDVVLHGCPDTGRRRLVYLRDYGAFSKALLPLLPSLLSATSSGSQTLIVAGVSPVKRASRSQSSQDESYKRYVSQLKSDTSSITYLKSRYAASWRLKYNEERFESLEDTFTILFLNRYNYKFLSRRGRAHSLVDQPPNMLTFSRVVRVGLVNDLHVRLRKIGTRDRQHRFLNANVHIFQGKLAPLGKSIQPVFVSDLDLDSLQNSAPDLIEVLTRRVLTEKEWDAVAPRLPATCTLIDVGGILDATKNLDNVWSDLVSIAEKDATSKIYPVKHLPAKEVVVSDPIVQRVKSDRNLSENERSLLSCIVDPTTISTTFEDVCVSPLVIETMRTAVSLSLLLPEAYSSGILATESVAGILLYGPPGTGKTMACRALAKESNVRMLQIQASSVQRKYVGESEAMIVAIFSLARKLGPCIVFIDELDALFGARTSKTPNWHSSEITEFLQEMDGLRTASLNKQKGVIVVGATNRPQDLDNAIIRRLPRRIFINLPDIDGRKNIITKYLRGEDTDDSVDIDAIAKRTPMFSGSDLKHLVLSAVLAALKDTLPTNWWKSAVSTGPPDAVSKRVVRAMHFESAMQEITASCATDPRNIVELERWSSGRY